MNKTEIIEFAIGTSQVLIDSFKGNGNLVVPTYSKMGKPKGSIRISEQELRLAAIHHLFQNQTKHSIETPTEQKYFFSGKSGLSAQTDLSIHDESKIKLRVEFKSNQPDYKSIQKDFLKLQCESEQGLFFHILKNTNSRTVDAFIDKCFKSINNLKSSPDYPRVENTEIEQKPFYIAILCLNYQNNKLKKPEFYFFESNQLDDLFQKEKYLENFTFIV